MYSDFFWIIGVDSYSALFSSFCIASNCYMCFLSFTSNLSS